jgi:hypothetical protein
MDAFGVLLGDRQPGTGEPKRDVAAGDALGFFLCCLRKIADVPRGHERVADTVAVRGLIM